MSGRTTLWIVFATVLATSACSPELPAPTSTAIPASITPDLGKTAEAQSLTAIAAYTPTASQTPTITKTPYPTITPIPSATIFLSQTPTTQPPSLNGTDVTGSPGAPTPSVDYACKVTSKFPQDWTPIHSADTFNASWTFQNTGTQLWKLGKVVITFISGTKLQQYKDQTTFNLPADVQAGTSATGTFEMVAPKKPDQYASNWGLMVTSSKTIFCTFSTRITVIPAGK